MGGLLRRGANGLAHFLRGWRCQRKNAAQKKKRGYSDADIEGVMHGNWLRFFKEAWNKRDAAPG